jgi:hypothetical protein
MSDNKPKSPGPEPERVTAGGNWMQALGKALKKKKPPAGWPEPPGGYGNKKTRQKSE